MSSLSEIRLDGRVAVVTGAGRGLGRAYALDLAGRGARVVVNDVVSVDDGGSVADLVVKEILGAGGEAVANHDPIGTAEAGEAVVGMALDAFGRVDAVVNNAGFLRDASAAKMTPADFDAVIDVHLRGSFFVSQAAFRVMKEQSHGRLIFVSSAAGLFGNFGQANYSAAKCGIVGLSSTFALEGARCGVTSNVVAPVARTRLTEALMAGMGGMADALVPEFVAPFVTYLASEDCTLTHEVFSVGGGRFARVFIGESPGWFAGTSTVPTPEDIRAHLDGIRNLDGYAVPGSGPEEAGLLMQALMT